MKTEQWPNRPTRRSFIGRLTTIGLALVGGAASALGQSAAKAKPGPEWDTAYELSIDFELNQIEGFRTRRPYVAVWIEDKNGNSVRTLCLWMMSGPKGWRYLRSLRRWYRDDQYRVQLGAPDAATTVSSATRMAGKYSLVWNGKDNDDKFVPMGDYYVCIEAAREHGTYQLMWKAISVGTKPFSATIAGNVEIKEATIDYRKRK